MTFSIEVLPAPFGPMIARISPLRMSNERPRSPHAAERQRNMLDRQQDVATLRRQPRVGPAAGGVGRQIDDAERRVEPCLCGRLRKVISAEIDGFLAPL